MPAYAYEVLDDGQRRSGTLEARSVLDAGEILKRDRLVVLSIREVGAETTPEEAETARSSRSRLERSCAGPFIPSVRREMALRQLATLLRAGTPIIRALRVVAAQSPRMFARALEGLGEKVWAGAPFERSLREEMAFLGNVTLGLLAVGEANGTLPEMCAYAADLLEKRRLIRNQVLGAMVYPCIILLVALPVIYFLITNVVPKLIKFISARSGTLHPVTQALVDVTDFARAYGLYFVGVPTGILLVYLLARRTEALGEPLDRAVLSLPLLGRVFSFAANSIWLRTLSSLYTSGINAVKSISLTSDSIWNKHYRRQFALLEQAIRGGQSITAGLETTTLPVFCPLGHAMIRVGEETGELSANLLHAADFYDEEVRRRVELMARLIEPALIVVVGGLVMFVYIAFFMGVMSATRSIQ